MLFSHKSSSKYCQTSALFFLHCSHYKKRKFWWQVTRTNEGLQSQYLKIQENKIIFHQAKCWRKSISKKANYQWTSTLQEKCDLTQENVKRFNWVMQSWAELTELSFFTPFKKNKLWNFLQNRKSKSHNYRKLWGLFFDRQAKTNVTLGIYLNHDATCRSSHPWH